MKASETYSGVGIRWGEGLEYFRNVNKAKNSDREWLFQYTKSEDEIDFVLRLLAERIEIFFNGLITVLWVGLRTDCILCRMRFWVIRTNSSKSVIRWANSMPPTQRIHLRYTHFRFQKTGDFQECSRSFHSSYLTVGISYSQEFLPLSLLEVLTKESRIPPPPRDKNGNGRTSWGFLESESALFQSSHWKICLSNAQNSTIPVRIWWSSVHNSWEVFRGQGTISSTSIHRHPLVEPLRCRSKAKQKIEKCSVRAPGREHPEKWWKTELLKFTTLHGRWNNNGFSRWAERALQRFHGQIFGNDWHNMRSDLWCLEDETSSDIAYFRHEITFSYCLPLVFLLFTPSYSTACACLLVNQLV